MTEKALIAIAESSTALDVADLLRRERFEITVAPDAITAVAGARRERPDLIVLAATLPGGRGAHVLQRIRTNATTAVTSVVGLASSGDESRELIGAGANAITARPIEEMLLLAAVDSAMACPAGPAIAPAFALADAPRLAAVHAAGLSGTPPEEMFDRYTRLVARLLDAPTALFTLVDDSRQFIKSGVGLDLPPQFGNRQIPLTHSFCQWVVADRTVLSVDDARLHPTLRANQAVPELDFIAYCGVPVMTHEGHAVGALCAVDSKPHSWTAEDVSLLNDLAASLGSEIELHRLRASA